ncbi:MAG TPA: hypothetical protein VNI20_04095 [Fimbriimonadaceae bacterium]|nr:hypothetical protein [Fimbriimonadaceae bacterium]
MKRAALLIAAFGLFSTSFAQESLVKGVMGQFELSPTEAAMAIVVADALGMKVDAVVRISNDHDEPFSIIGPALIIGKYTHHDVGYVLRHRGNGKAWGNVAKELGMHPGDFNKMRVKGESFESGIWINLLSTRYGMKSGDYSRNKQKGLSDFDLVLAAVVSKGKTKDFDSTCDKIKAKMPKKGGGEGHGNSGGHGGGHGHGG